MLSSIISGFSLIVIAVSIIYILVVIFSDSLNTKEKAIRFLISFVLVLLASSIFVISAGVYTYEQCDKTEIYSLPLLDISEKASNDYGISNNVYVLENFNGEYIFYTVYHTGEYVKRTVDKSNVIIAIDNSKKPFVEVYKETYNAKNLLGSTLDKQTIEKYYLTIPNGGIISDSISNSL